jgi:hypothetical protein
LNNNRVDGHVENRRRKNGGGVREREDVEHLKKPVLIITEFL